MDIILRSARDTQSQIKVLWDCSTAENTKTGWFMMESQTIDLPEPLSSQNRGIVLMWQPYGGSGSAPLAYDVNYSFVPKAHSSYANNYGIDFFLANQTGNHVAIKYIYVTDNALKGHANNDKGATNSDSGITFEPDWFVLTRVFGV